MEKKSQENNTEKLTADEMAEFYKKFLNDNLSIHRNYNTEWYKKNLACIYLAFRVSLQKLFTKS